MNESEATNATPPTPQPTPHTLSEKLASLPNLKDVVFKGNPFWETFEGENAQKRIEMLKFLPNLSKVRPV